MDMPRKAPKTGHPLIDNLLLLSWLSIFGMSISQMADLMVAVGGLLTAVLTALRIYQHLAGETVVGTVLRVFGKGEDAEA